MLCLIVSLAALGSATAAPVTFTIDPTKTVVNITGKVLGSEFREQAPGSLAPKFGGTLNADVTATTLQLTGGSVIDALVNGEWTPKTGGVKGTEVGDFAGQATVLFGSQVTAAARDVQFDATSGIIPLAAGKFDSSGVVFAFVTNASGRLDYRVEGIVAMADSKPLVGYSTNKITTAAELSGTGDTLRLVLPIDTTMGMKLLSDNDVTITLRGQIVATGKLNLPLALSFEVIGGQLRLTWTSTAGQSFRIESSRDLSQWTTRVAAQPSGGASTTWAVQASSALEFFRVVRLP
jgi:hypothetical protein